MIFQKYNPDQEKIEEALKSLTDEERAFLRKRQGFPLFWNPTDTLREIKERHGLTWMELREVIYSI